MTRTRKELAFLRDLSLANDWTERFTNLVDASLQLPEEGRFLYLNSGTGNHALELREKMNKEVEIFGVSEDEETAKIARAKADALKADVMFQSSGEFPDEFFDAVLADASLVRPNNLPQFFDRLLNLTAANGEITFFLPTAGSFGEIFSYLWETFFCADENERGVEVERLITELPTVSDVEETAEFAGLKKIETRTENEIFEYDTGEEFVNSSLVADFLLPVWLEFLGEKEKKQVTQKLAQTINLGRDGLTFRFSVKATLVSGRKA